MKKLLILIPLIILVSCTTLSQLRKEINRIDDAVIEGITAKVEKSLEEQAQHIVKKAVEEAEMNEELIKKVDNEFLQKSYGRLEPIIDEAMTAIKPAIEKAAKEIQDQVREEILEELTGEEINEACPDCPKKESAEKESVEKKPVEKEPVEEKPAEEESVEKKPVVEEKPAEKESAEEKPVEKEVEKEPEKSE